MTSTLIASAWGAIHQSLKWSSLSMQQVDSAWIGNKWKVLLVDSAWIGNKWKVLLEEQNNLYIWSNEHNLISSEEMIISEILKGVYRYI